MNLLHRVEINKITFKNVLKLWFIPKYSRGTYDSIDVSFVLSEIVIYYCKRRFFVFQ